MAIRLLVWSSGPTKLTSEPAEHGGRLYLLLKRKPSALLKHPEGAAMCAILVALYCEAENWR